MVLAIIVSAVLLSIGTGYFFTTRWLRRRLKSIYEERTSPDAQIRAFCQVAAWNFESPGVAQIAGGTLSVFTVTGKEVRVPLDQVRLVKTRKNNLYGHYAWWGKTCFWLQCPDPPRMKLGFADPQPWTDIFEKQ